MIDEVAPLADPPLRRAFRGVVVTWARDRNRSPNEELLLFALPIALLTRGRPRSRTFQIGVWAVIFLIRLGIHLYYGWGAVFVLPWMIGAYLLFKYLGTIWPMVAAHAVYDALASLSGRAPQTYDAVHNIFEAAVIAAGMTLASLMQRQRTLSTPQPPHH